MNRIAAWLAGVAVALIALAVFVSLYLNTTS